MLIHLEKLGKSFGEKIVLHDVTASVEREDRIGIVGQNGAGKTTLLKILTGEYQDYEGEFSVTHGVTLGYLEQNSKLDPTLDVYGEMRKAFQPVLDAMARMQVVEKQLALHPEADGREELLEEHAHLSAVVDAALRTAQRNGAYIAAICAAPSVLGKRGYLEGVRAVCFPGFEPELRGAILQPEGLRVVTDGKFITAVGMGAALEFGLALVRVLLGDERAQELRRSVLAD